MSSCSLSPASGFPLLPSLCKLLYQLCEASGKSEVEGIHSGVGNLKPTALLLKKVLELSKSASEAQPEAFSKVKFYVNMHNSCTCTILDDFLCVLCMSLSLSPPPPPPPVHVVNVHSYISTCINANTLCDSVTIIVMLCMYMTSGVVSSSSVYHCHHHHFCTHKFPFSLLSPH